MSLTPKGDHTPSGRAPPSERRNLDLLSAALCSREKRSSQQVLKLSAWVATLPGMDRLSQAALHQVAHNLYGVELHIGSTLYRAGDAADWFYCVMDGTIVFTDIREPEDGSDPIVGVAPANTTFGEEEILSNSRRPFTAVAQDLTVTVLRLPMVEYQKTLEDIHVVAYEAKVAFLASLSPIKPLKDHVIRKLCSCFSVAAFRKGDVVVRQGDKADAMYAIRSGTCGVLVDPHYKEESEGLGELEPKKTVQVVTLNAGAIIGDVTVLAKLRKRTASVIAHSDVTCYKIRRATFIRRLPIDQLEILRRIASEKLKLMDQKIKSRPAQTKGAQNQILQGHNLRQLLFQQTQAAGQPRTDEYQQLIHVLRRYKRSAAPQTLPPGAPHAFVSSGGWDYPGLNSAIAGRGTTQLSGALRASLTNGNAPTANIVPELRENPPSPTTPGPHRDWRGRDGRDPTLTDGSMAMKAALLRVLPDGYASFHPPQQQLTNSMQGMYWRPISPRRTSHPSSDAIRDGVHTPSSSLQEPLNYSHRPFIASVTLRTLAQTPGTDGFGIGTGTGAGGQYQGGSPPASPLHGGGRYAGAGESAAHAGTHHAGGSGTARVWTSGEGEEGPPGGHKPRPWTAAGAGAWPGAWAATGLSRPASPPGGRESVGSAWSSTALWRKPDTTQMHPQHYDALAIDFHTDPDGVLQPGKREIAGNVGSKSFVAKESNRVEAALDALSKPLMQARPKGMSRGTAHFRPTVPKAML